MPEQLAVSAAGLAKQDFWIFAIKQRNSRVQMHFFNRGDSQQQPHQISLREPAMGSGHHKLHQRQPHQRIQNPPCDLLAPPEVEPCQRHPRNEGPDPAITEMDAALQVEVS